jgi:hypothetical protein
MFALRHRPTQKFFRTQVNAGSTNLVADGDLTNSTGLLLLSDLWAVTQFTNLHLKKADMKAIEIVEVELRAVRIVPPAIDVEAKPDEAPGNQLSIAPIVRT